MVSDFAFICVSQHLCFFFFFFWLFCFLLLHLFVCFILSALFVFIYYMSICILAREIRKGCGFGWVGKWGWFWRDWGRGNHNQYILHEKKIFNLKKKIESNWGKYPSRTSISTCTHAHIYLHYIYIHAHTEVKGERLEENQCRGVKYPGTTTQESWK